LPSGALIVLVARKSEALKARKEKPAVFKVPILLQEVDVAK
jgi:hypothetical protein